jgi:hypothetical protein
VAKFILCLSRHSQILRHLAHAIEHASSNGITTPSTGPTTHFETSTYTNPHVFACSHSSTVACSGSNGISSSLTRTISGTNPNVFACVYPDSHAYFDISGLPEISEPLSLRI